VRAIVYQQLAGRAAAAIHSRLVGALAGDVRPESLIALDDAALRAAGLSANKAASLRRGASVQRTPRRAGGRRRRSAPERSSAGSLGEDESDLVVLDAGVEDHALEEDGRLRFDEHRRVFGAAVEDGILGLR
jgi:hypothetical protein